ncbi:carboxylesterase [Nakamurella panacisegetis]|uniref:Carboxylesterase n=1 Tax=Nakamurella panacisegetis TaxID=1090615 RepID=A0A1H0R2U0_9ACTN|nr:alpha/beta fold hydrolase [Nakamurella panacisegetis]SDP23843.1 carboxylesterase [Nakamurella panacisegetis]
MASSPDRESSRPFRHPGGDVGVLLCHGFTGNPSSLRPWADRLAAEGFTVELPLLPGHGTTWQQMNRTTFDDWLGAVSSSLSDLNARCRSVVVAGLSMGGTLTLRLAELHGNSIAGIVLVNPSVLSLRKELKLLPVLKHLVPSLKGIADDIAAPGRSEFGYDRTPLKAVDALRKGWASTRTDLARVTAPVLLLRSRIDHVVEPENSTEILARIGSTDVTEIVLERSYHVATLDHDAELIFDSSVEFVRRVTHPSAVAGQNASEEQTT